MRLKIRTGDLVILTGKSLKITQISELTADEKTKKRIPTKVIARQLTLEDNIEIIFLS